jgi:hypothetical protein
MTRQSLHAHGEIDMTTTLAPSLAALRSEALEEILVLNLVDIFPVNRTLEPHWVGNCGMYWNG